MTRFVDEYLPECVFGYEFIATPRWSTNLASSSSGAESVLQKWQHPLWRYQAPEGVRNFDIYNALYHHWLVMRGPVHTFPLRDPMDFASVALSAPNVAPTITGTDQVIGTANGSQTQFQLVRTYAVGAQTYVRKIHLPVVASVIVTDNNVLVDPADYTVSRYGGIITFDVAPTVGHTIRAGYLFDVEVRFEDDNSFDGIFRVPSAGAFADFSLIETRPC